MDLTDNFTNFAERLKITRKECGLTQKDVAKALGMSEGGYNSYEKAKREPNIDKLWKLANLFNVSADFLINTNKYNKNVVLNDIEKKLLEIFRKLNLQGQEYIMQTIDMAKDKYIKSDSVVNMENIN